MEDVDAEEGGTNKNMNGSDDDEEEEAEMSDPTVFSNPGAILNVSAVADALANNPEAAKILEQHQQLDKRQRQQFLMQGKLIQKNGYYHKLSFFYRCNILFLI